MLEINIEKLSDLKSLVTLRDSVGTAELLVSGGHRVVVKVLGLGVGDLEMVNMEVHARIKTGFLQGDICKIDKGNVYVLSEKERHGDTIFTLYSEGRGNYACRMSDEILVVHNSEEGFEVYLK